MTKEDILKLIPDATPEQIVAIQNSVDTEVAIAKKSTVSADELKDLREKAEKFDAAEAEKLSNEQKLQKMLDDAAKSKTENAKLLNRTKAIAELTAAGLTEDDYKDLIDGIVSDNEENTVNMAKSLSALITKKKADFETDFKDKQMHKFEKPSGGSTAEGGNNKTEAETFAESIAKSQATALKSADEARKFYTGGN
jgi:hypothetical protein